MLVRTGREGLAARAGHDLTLEITEWSARITVPDSGDIAAATVTAELNLGSITVREGRGGAKPLSDKDRRDIRNQARKILGDTATASFASTSTTPSAGPPSGGTIEGTLTINGVARPVQLQVTEEAADEYRGSAVIRQTDFGITPYSGFFGALKLSDEVTIEFEAKIE